MKREVATLLLVMGVCILANGYIQRVKAEQSVAAMSGKQETVIVVVDAGHGGKDPGKVAVNDALEKEINLSIAMQVKSLLEQNGIVVVATREDDRDLASENASSRKNEDLRARVTLIKESGADLVVSIHQNSYPEADVDGAQVFYYAGSDEGKLLGTMIQEQLKNEIEDGNHRIAKANKDYYLLKKSIAPAVIVECGFLSNEREAALLTTEEYQRKIAYAIHLGILEYINTAEIPQEE